MSRWVLNFLLFLLSGTCGYFLVNAIFPGKGPLGFLTGLVPAGLALLLERQLTKTSLRTLLGGVAGFVSGLLMAILLRYTFSPFFERIPSIALPLYGLFIVLSGYIGVLTGLKRMPELPLPIRFPEKSSFEKTGVPQGIPKILDTSVIIDGRIADIAETGFLEGPLLIPQFILGELQHIADSHDPLKRTRGRRGLEILQHLQKQVNVDVRIVETDYASAREVDAKLIELAKEVHGKIITNDSNLNKVAGLQGIEVLNINALANSLKPIVLPGEEINAKIVKEGKEMGQGVAYLDDGTMIVVDNGKKQIGKNIDVVVTSVLQTPAGRMIFARLKEEASRDSRGRELDYPLDSEF